MDITKVWEGLARSNGGRIVYVVLDGLGGLPNKDVSGTALQMAATPNLDFLARESACGLLETVGPGITPGSGPGHLALFGYDPFEFKLGRGILSALGIDFRLKSGDVAGRVNFATIDRQGRVVDRRAGRINTEKNRELCTKVGKKINLENFQGKFFFETVKEHRAVLILRGDGLGGDVTDTDPQTTGSEPLEPKAKNKNSEHTTRVIKSFIHQVKNILADEDQANTILTRGIDRYDPFPSLKQRFKLRAACVAAYPMYRGVSRLLGMSIAAQPETGTLDASFAALEDVYGGDQDFFFLHVKKTDSSGEDGDFGEKVKTLEAVDTLIPKIANLKPDVLVVTGDHSTPARLKHHSWHPVPVMLHAQSARVDAVKNFDEYGCLAGSLGLRPGVHFIGLALAHAGRLRKYGA
jgi:2,3-bisphosphoglycerate-independent phosphoglycerate mutase